jgi:hypothetical protein
MEEWKEREKRQGALGGEWITAGAWVFYEVNSVAVEVHTPKWLERTRHAFLLSTPRSGSGARTSPDCARDKK